MQSIFIQSTKYLQFEVKSICKLIECFNLFLSSLFIVTTIFVFTTHFLPRHCYGTS